MDKRKKMKAKAAAGTALLLGMSTISGNLVHAMEQGEPVETGEVNEVESNGIQPLADDSTTEAQTQAPYDINEVNFPDEGVRQWINNNINRWDSANNGKLTATAISKATNFNPDNANVLSKLSDLRGLEKFTNITQVSLNNATNLTSLDGLSTMTGITSVSITNATKLTSVEGLKDLSNLTTVNLQGATALKDVTAVLSNKDQLTTLNIAKTGVAGTVDVSGLPNLATLTAWRSQVTGFTFGASNTKLNNISILDITTLKELNGVEHLTCTDGDGITLDIKNTAIPELTIKSNQKFASINIEANSTFKRLEIEDGATVKVLNMNGASGVTSIDLPASSLNMTTLNLNGATALESISNLENQLGTLTSLTLNGTKLTDAPEVLDFSSNSTITSINLSNMPSTTVKLPSGDTLTSLTLNNVKAESLDLENKAALTTISLANTGEAEVKLPTTVRNLTLDNVKLEGGLDLKNYTSLTAITLKNIEGGELTSLPSSFTGNTLTLENVMTKDLDLSSFATLRTVNLYSMPKGFSVKFGSNSPITTLALGGTDLSEKSNYTIEGTFPELQHLLLNNTKIKSFDSASVKDLPKINRVVMDNNSELESIKISGTDGNKIKRLKANNNSKLTSLTIEDNKELMLVEIGDATNLTNDGLTLADSYEELGYLGLYNSGLTGTFKVPEFKTDRNETYYEDGSALLAVGVQIDIENSDIEKLDVTNAGTLNSITLRNCSKLTDIVGIEDLDKLNCLVIGNIPNLHYLDLPNFASAGSNILQIDGTDLAYVNIPDNITLNLGYNASNLVTQSIDVEIGGYDKEKGYWADLNESFPGIKIDHISDLQPLDATARANSGMWLDTDSGKIYGIKPNDYATYTYKVNNKYNMNPKIHFVDIKLVDKAEDVPVGDTNVEITLPGGSVAESDGSFTTPGNTTVNQDGTITTESGTTVTIPDKGSEVLESGDVTTSGNTTINSDGTITTESGTTIKIPDKGSVVTENGNTTVGDITINNDGTITTDEGTTIKVPSTGTTINEDGSIETSGGTVVKPDGTITNANGDTIKPNGNEVHIDESGTVTLPEGGAITDQNGNTTELKPGGAVESDGTILNNGSIEAITPDKNGNNGGVVTGDTTQAGVWGAGALLSAMLLGVFGYRRKKEKEETK